jgi:hypothetical protein
VILLLFVDLDLDFAFEGSYKQLLILSSVDLLLFVDCDFDFEGWGRGS